MPSGVLMCGGWPLLWRGQACGVCKCVMEDGVPEGCFLTMAAMVFGMATTSMCAASLGVERKRKERCARTAGSFYVSVADSLRRPHHTAAEYLLTSRRAISRTVGSRQHRQDLEQGARKANMSVKTKQSNDLFTTTTAFTLLERSRRNWYMSLPTSSSDPMRTLSCQQGKSITNARWSSIRSASHTSSNVTWLTHLRRRAPPRSISKALFLVLRISSTSAYATTIVLRTTFALSWPAM